MPLTTKRYSDLPPYTQPLLLNETLTFMQGGVTSGGPISCVTGFRSFLSGQPNVDETGVTPSIAGVQAWVNLLAQNGWEGVWDCPVYCQIGQTVANTIIMPSNVSIRFTGAGVCITDGQGIPAFMFPACSDVTFTNLTVKYIPHPTLGSYGNNGAPAVNGGAIGTAANVFLQTTLKTYLQNQYNANHATGVNFSGTNAFPVGNSITNGSALLFIKGACNRVRFLGKSRFYVPDGATADQFIPAVCAVGQEWIAGSTVTSSTPQNPSTIDIPINVEFEDVEVDGAYFGFVGSAHNFIVKKSHFMRYSDLQASLAVDSTGQFIGGNGNWFAPPHAFYVWSVLAGLPCTHQNTDCLDDGTYVGINTRRSSTSGYMHSMKYEPANNGALVNFRCFRPDGAVQVLSAGNSTGKIVGLFASCNTTTGFAVNSGATPYSAQALVFPSSQPLLNCFIEATIVDTAPVPTNFPVGSDATAAHQNVIFNVNTIVQDYPATNYTGTSLSGNPNTGNYATGGVYPGFGFGGNGCQIYHNCTFVACTNVTQTFRGTLANQGATALTNSVFYVTVTGWRVFTLSGGQGFDGLKQRVIIGANGTNIGNRARVIDTSNGWMAEIDNNLETETWTQDGQFTMTAGATFNTGFQFPVTMAIVAAGWAVITGPLTGTGGSLTNAEIGTATIPNIVGGLNINTPNPRGLPPIATSYQASSLPIIISPVGGATAFAATGTFYCAVTGKQTSMVG